MPQTLRQRNKPAQNLRSNSIVCEVPIPLGLARELRPKASCFEKPKDDFNEYGTFIKDMPRFGVTLQLWLTLDWMCSIDHGREW